MLGLEFLLGLILFLSFAFPYIIPLAFLGWLFLKFHTDIISFLRQMLIAIWHLHITLGVNLVRAVRDTPINKYWKDSYYKSWIMRTAIILWLVIVPTIFLAGLIFIGVFVERNEAAAIVLKIALFLGFLFWITVSELKEDAPTLLAAIIFCFFAVCITPWPSAVVIFYGYYRYYLYGPLSDYRLVWFVREYHLMWMDIRLAQKLLPTFLVRLEAWWNTQKSTFSKIVRSEWASLSQALDAFATEFNLKGENHE